MVDITPKLFYVPYKIKESEELAYLHVPATNENQAIGVVLDRVRDSEGKRLELIIFKDKIEILENLRDTQGKKYRIHLKEIK